MTDKLRTWIAAALTAWFLAAVSVAGVIAHGNRLPSTTALTQAAARGVARGATHPSAPPTWKDQERD
jgi:hypothetical protein